MHTTRLLKVGTLGAAVVLLAAACGSSSSPSTSSGGNGTQRPAPPAGTAATSVGTGEGTLNLITWPDYADDGSNGTPDTTGPFTKATGCKVNVKVGNTSDEMVTLMKSGQYDGVSASGDATLRLIYGGDVAPVNTSLVPNYATVSDFLKNKQWNSVNGQMYGIPHGWGANVLAYNLATVKPAPTSWSVVFDANSPYKGKITAYDSPIYIADAALYLMKTKPDLKITNPYALDQTQFQAAVDLLKQQRTMISSYWASYTDEVKSFDAGASVVGTAWQVNVNTMKPNTVGSLVPTEGATGWSDTWMISSKAAHPNCMYKWLDYIISPEANAGVAYYFGEAPAQTKACDVSADMKTFCQTYHALDSAYADSISYWTTPTKNCLDGRGDICVDYSAWVQAWTDIKG